MMSIWVLYALYWRSLSLFFFFSLYVSEVSVSLLGWAGSFFFLFFLSFFPSFFLSFLPSFFSFPFPFIATFIKSRLGHVGWGVTTDDILATIKYMVKATYTPHMIGLGESRAMEWG